MARLTPFTDEENRKLIELYEKGEKYQVICLELGKSYKSIMNQARRLGLKPRDKERKEHFIETDSNGRKVKSVKKILVWLRQSSYAKVYNKAKERNMYTSEYVRQLIEADIQSNQ